MTIQATSSTAPSSPVTYQSSPWHSPVPYFFGDGERSDLEAGDSKYEDHKESTVSDEKYLVIMAGEVKPTFLATPVSSRTSSFGSCGCRSSSREKLSTSEVEMMEKKGKEGSSDHLQVRNTVDQETPDEVL